MKYFFFEYHDIPAGEGYSAFSSTHLLSLVVVLAAVFVFVHLFSKMASSVQDRIMKICPILMFSIEIIKQIVLFIDHRNSVEYIPFHLCNIGALVFLLYAFNRSPWWKRYFGEVAWECIIPAAAMALLFPNWIGYYPTWNFFSLVNYMWHALLIAYPISLVVTGRIHPGMKHFWYGASFMGAIAVMAVLINAVLGTNFMFLSKPSPGSPLSMLALVFGTPGYIIWFLLLVVIVLLMMELPFWFYDKRKRNLFND